jgi:hypothetical protein
VAGADKPASAAGLQLPNRFGRAMAPFFSPIEPMSTTSASKDSKEFRILSLSGGGFLGLYTAVVLADL